MIPTEIQFYCSLLFSKFQVSHARVSSLKLKTFFYLIQFSQFKLLAYIINLDTKSQKFNEISGLTHMNHFV